MRFLIPLAFSLCLAHPAFAQVRYTTFEKLDSAVQAAPRKTFVFIHTSWCAYCNMMEHTTLQDKPVVQLLNSCFYSISLDAEQKQSILFKGKTYAFEPQGVSSGQHQLAALLMKGEKAALYPSFVLLDEQYRIIYRYGGYVSSKQLLHLLQRACAGQKDITVLPQPDSVK
ncbi:MAG TPA: thioredoxin family protein [Chitinophaga sp.]|uniref:thioredoxin family protein n=1 Tax=Chitinophaga sp. TaxID=1869181 RepID=UPI002F92A35A